MGNKHMRPVKRMQSMKKSMKHRPVDGETKTTWYLVPVGVGTKNRVYMKFSSQDVYEVKDAFAMYDKNYTGTIPTKSFISVMRSLGHNLTEEETYDMIREVDFNNTGVIHFMEFVQTWAKFSTDIDDTIKEAFNLFDKDGSGSISMDEFREVMVTEGAQMTDDEIEEILSAADANGDGQIDINEFVALLIKD